MSEKRCLMKMFQLLAFLVAAMPFILSAAVTSASSDAISLDASEWSSVTAVSEEALTIFISTPPATIIILR